MVKISSRNIFILCGILISCCSGYGQKSVAITIDDVPNTRIYSADNCHSKLLSVLDSLQIPFAIFINEGLLKKYEEDCDNQTLLSQWLSHKNVTAGNHTYSHSRYSEVGLENFTSDILQGAQRSKAIADSLGKPFIHFRFPYNDLGADSLAHVEIDRVLTSLGYRISPFTIESSDWIFNAVYEHYLQSNDTIKAAEIGRMYVDITRDYFHFYDSLSQQIYHRSVKQIYLCHDNRLNADYLSLLVKRLREESYTFISYDEALSDPVYNQSANYFKKWGISWFYRWMDDPSIRRAWMEAEPETAEIEQLFEALDK
ncbi:MAG: polysaccharide deacetylase family protein [Cryomorphaceae bacterium]|nr:polysaccharide deacetylase family protein [Cryomorphaceae bacterium]